MFLVQSADSAFLFDCPFDEIADDYPQCYVVYRIATESSSIVTDGDWSGLPDTGIKICEVKVTDVQFDDTKRVFVDSRILDQIK